MFCFCFFFPRSWGTRSQDGQIAGRVNVLQLGKRLAWWGSDIVAAVRLVPHRDVPYVRSHAHAKWTKNAYAEREAASASLIRYFRYFDSHVISSTACIPASSLFHLLQMPDAVPVPSPRLFQAPPAVYRVTVRESVDNRTTTREPSSTLLRSSAALRLCSLPHIASTAQFNISRSTSATAAYGPSRRRGAAAHACLAFSGVALREMQQDIDAGVAYDPGMRIFGICHELVANGHRNDRISESPPASGLRFRLVLTSPSSSFYSPTSAESEWAKIRLAGIYRSPYLCCDSRTPMEALIARLSI
ncbi:hypothetical protein ONZ51_g1843 [Trametes cubensis]|uniref:Uncharacterized protein n=1 Tax=Trametes cubensis TaxID=1111947 RepID=A0AAD7U0S8_9APHY|nr:hypothetical protein ONZ51_g1843 [Trametes cubensis]